jgi:hypothetical protein
VTIIDIFEALRARGLARSLRHFSQEFLSREPNHACDTGLARCSAGATLNLYRRMGEPRQVDLQAKAFERLLDVEARS